MRFKPIPAWKQAPFLRLLLPFIGGIFFQYNIDFNFRIALSLLLPGSIAILLLNKTTLRFRFKTKIVTGICVQIIFISTGCLAVFVRDIRNRMNWFGRNPGKDTALVLRITEPLSEKAKSYKTIAAVESMMVANKIFPASGNIILYFRKDSIPPLVAYGSLILVSKQTQSIRNTGNPGSFDYKKYSAFQNVYHQLFLQQDEYKVLHEKKTSVIPAFIFGIRENILSILRRYIHREKELGLAQALLIGYKDDLDKDLVQSYTNTGVVHVIAISGLHLGIIYWLLALLCKPLRKNKSTRWLRPIVIITGLWLFSLLAGGGPSVLRSALMFSCIVTGESFSKKSNIYNSLAASAFILLCINPFWLWDVGFQLSYIAVLSLVVFMKPIYHLVYIENKVLDTIWQLAAVTLAAQILTIPLCMYHFHQLPVYFLFSNILAVPLSSLVLMAEIVLLLVNNLEPVANFTGRMIESMIWLLDAFIEHIESLPFAVWDGLQVSMVQVLLLYIFIVAVSYWLFKQDTVALFAALSSIIFFFLLRTVSFIEAEQQQTMIVYNVPQKQAIDLMCGRRYQFIGDAALLDDNFLTNFHLKPSRVLHRVTRSGQKPTIVSTVGFVFANKRIVVINKDPGIPTSPLLKADIVVVSQNAAVSLKAIDTAFDKPIIVLDGSNPPWRLRKWREEAAQHGLRCVSVVDNGAFVLKVD